MTVLFFDRQDVGNPNNGTRLQSPTELRPLLDRAQARPPFFAELIGDNGFKLLVGVGGPEGCAQYSASGGTAPYLMAVAGGTRDAHGEVEFLMGGTASPVPRRYCLPYETLVAVAEHFVESGDRFPGVEWEEV